MSPLIVNLYLQSHYFLHDSYLKQTKPLLFAGKLIGHGRIKTYIRINIIQYVMFEHYGIDADSMLLCIQASDHEARCTYTVH
jgi:hypothetical protein